MFLLFQRRTDFFCTFRTLLGGFFFAWNRNKNLEQGDRKVKRRGGGGAVRATDPYDDLTFDDERSRRGPRRDDGCHRTRRNPRLVGRRCWRDHLELSKPHTVALRAPDWMRGLRPRPAPFCEQEKRLGHVLTVSEAPMRQTRPTRTMLIFRSPGRQRFFRLDVPHIMTGISTVVAAQTQIYARV